MCTDPNEILPVNTYQFTRAVKLMAKKGQLREENRVWEPQDLIRCERTYLQSSGTNRCLHFGLRHTGRDACVMRRNNTSAFFSTKTAFIPSQVMFFKASRSVRHRPQQLQWIQHRENK